MKESRRKPKPDAGRRLTAASEPSLRVIEVVADAMGVDPLECPPIYETIDLSALDELFRGREDAAGRVTFEYEGFVVDVPATGPVTVSRRVDEE
ncbi:HalOD1 output domain-containing protein [Salinilacihabitans rarus]|uniref:HalOD1 output domain-containing protein n=1 Tax=Salinilacihabitans rarus TaxID=2961596 RepID=UPI0020C8C0E0|nr:HalOD1 output domain-containing protein [Salinilacihabitans rarus]